MMCQLLVAAALVGTFQCAQAMKLATHQVSKDVGQEGYIEVANMRTNARFPTPVVIHDPLHEPGKCRRFQVEPIVPGGNAKFLGMPGVTGVEKDTECCGADWATWCADQYIRVSTAVQCVPGVSFYECRAPPMITKPQAPATRREQAYTDRILRTQTTEQLPSPPNSKPTKKAVKRKKVDAGGVAVGGVAADAVVASASKPVIQAKPKAAVVTTATTLTAYLDKGSCGPLGNDHNAEAWCGGFKVGWTPSMCNPYVPVSTSLCVRGIASLDNVRTLISIDDCFYTYYAQYKCDLNAEEASMHQHMLASTTTTTVGIFAQQQQSTIDAPSSNESSQAPYGSALLGRCIDEDGTEVKHVFKAHLSEKACEKECNANENCDAYGYSGYGNLCNLYGGSVHSGNENDIFAGGWTAGSSKSTGFPVDSSTSVWYNADVFICKLRLTATLEHLLKSRNVTGSTAENGHAPTGQGQNEDDDEFDPEDTYQSAMGGRCVDFSGNEAKNMWKVEVPRSVCTSACTARTYCEAYAYRHKGQLCFLYGSDIHEAEKAGNEIYGGWHIGSACSASSPVDGGTDAFYDGPFFSCRVKKDAIKRADQNSAKPALGLSLAVASLVSVCAALFV